MTDQPAQAPSDLPENPHYVLARTVAQEGGYFHLTQAVLALAYEQRTANLIAASGWLSVDPEIGQDLSERDKAHREVRARLGFFVQE